MTQPLILDLLEPPLSRAEIEQAAPLLSFEVKVITNGCQHTVKKDAPDSTTAMKTVLDELFGDWDICKPQSYMKVTCVYLGEKQWAT